MRILTRRSLLPTWRRPPFLLLGAALGLWLATAGTALPAAGDLDASFGAGGRAMVDLGADEDATALALAPDGRIVVGGSRQNPAGPSATDGIVARLTPQGAIDTTYAGGGGWCRLDYSPNDNVLDVAVQPDGRILAAGYHEPANGFVAGLPNPGGTLDPTFGGGDGAFRELAFADGDGYSSVALQPDGRILARRDRALGPETVDDRHRRRAADPRRCARQKLRRRRRVVAHQLPAGPGAGRPMPGAGSPSRRTGRSSSPA